MHPLLVAFQFTVATLGLGRAPLSDADARTRRIVVAPAETLTVSSFAPFVNADSSTATKDWPTVVLLPNQIGSVFAMRRITVGLVARGYRVAVLDPLGMGASARPRGADYSLTAQAHRINRALDSLGLRRVLLVGQSTSASIAFRLASHDTTRVQGVLSLAGGPVNKQDGVRMVLAFSLLIDTPFGRSFARRKFANAMRAHSVDARWCTAEVVRAYLAPYERDLRGALRALSAMSDAVESEPIGDRLAAIRVPVRLLVGDTPASGSPTLDQIAMLRSHLADFRVDTVRSARTMLHEEHPDVVIDAIVALRLASSSRPAP